MRRPRMRQTDCRAPNEADEIPLDRLSDEQNEFAMLLGRLLAEGWEREHQLGAGGNKEPLGKPNRTSR